MRSLVPLALKDLVILRRDRMAAFFTLAFPLGIALFFGMVFGGGGAEGSVRVAVVDRDGSAASARLVASLDSADAITVERMDSAPAEERVRKGDLPAYLVIDEGFGSSVVPFAPSPDTLLHLGVDPARTQSGAVIEGQLARAWFSLVGRAFKSPGELRARLDSASIAGGSSGLPEDQRRLLRGFLGSLDTFLSQVDTSAYQGGMQMSGPPLRKTSVARRTTGPRSAFEVTFPSGVLWSILACVATFATSIVRERREGTWLRLRLAPLSRWQVVAGKALACFLAATGTSVVLLAIGVLGFGVRPDSWGLLGISVVVVCAGFVGIMMLLASLGRSEQAVAGASWAVLLVMAMLGGGMIPLVAMPGWMQSLSRLSPVRWGILSLEGAIWRGFGPGEMLVPFAVLLGVGAASFAAGVGLLARREM